MQPHDEGVSEVSDSLQMKPFRCRGGVPNDSLLFVIPSGICREVSISAPSGHDSVSVLSLKKHPNGSVVLT